MSFFDIFKENNIIHVFPLFTAIYISFQKGLSLLSIMLAGSTILYFLIVAGLARNITLQRQLNQSKENVRDDVLKTLLNKKYARLSSISAFMNWSLLIISAIILYQFKADFIAYTFFWLLIVGFVFSLLSLFVLNWEIIKASFQKKDIQIPVMH